MLLLICLNLKQKDIGETSHGGKKAVNTIVPVKQLSNFWRTLEMTLINCDLNLILI